MNRVKQHSIEQNRTEQNRTEQNRTERKIGRVVRTGGFTVYQALYRKYRPRSFSDVTGQEHVTETLRNQIINDKLSHAYLFVGTRGTGKTTCAKILSRAVNCHAPVNGNPCNACPACIGIESGSILDVMELDAASNRGIDDVRALREEAFYSPAVLKKRVYIIDEVHMLTKEAFNALLKILEEPPEHLLFILATTELHKVPATILSRCQRFSFKRLSPAAIAERLSKIAAAEGFALTPDAAEKLSALADGSMRDGISLLDQCATGTVVDLQRVLDAIGLAGHQELLRLAEAIAGRLVADALESLHMLYNDGRDMAALLNELAALSRDILLFKLSQSSPLLSGNYSRNELSLLSDKLSKERLFYSLEVIHDAVSTLAHGGNAKLAAEMCVIRLCDESLSDEPAAMLARLARLESGITAKPEIAQRPEPVPEPEPESEPEPEPEPESEPEPELANDFWQEILKRLQKEKALYVILSDPDKAQAELRDGLIILNVKDIFSANTIGTKTNNDLIKSVAQQVLGREVIIRVETVAGNGEPGKRTTGIDNLISAFGGIVKTE